MDPCTDFMTKFMSQHKKNLFFLKMSQGSNTHANVNIIEFESVKPKLSAIFSDFYLFDLDLTS